MQHDPRHSEHCRRCKERVREMLVQIYGDCRVNYQFPWSANPEPYLGTSGGDALGRIRVALGDLRGQRNFIKSALVPPCDYYLPEKNFIVEFDENQHFSRARMHSLSCYPDDLTYGFSVARWKELCSLIEAVDDTPVDRDERRAWYDALRDLVPAFYGLGPTVRLYAGDHEWCSLNAANPKDRDRFHSLLGK